MDDIKANRSLNPYNHTSGYKDHAKTLPAKTTAAWYQCPTRSCRRRNQNIRRFNQRRHTHRPVSGQRHIVGNTIDNYNVCVTGRDLVLEQDQAIGWTKHADPGMPLRNPVTRDRVIAGVAELSSVVGKNTAIANRVRRQEALARWP